MLAATIVSLDAGGAQSSSGKAVGRRSFDDEAANGSKENEEKLRCSLIRSRGFGLNVESFQLIYC